MERIPEDGLSEQIEQTNEKDRYRSKLFRMRHAEVLKRGKGADCGRYQIIGYKQKGADD